MKQGLIDPKKTELLVQFSGDTDFTKIVELTAIPFPTSSWTPADVTALDDMAKRVADAGVIENGVVEIRGLMISGSVQQNQIFVINRIKSCLCYKIVLSDPLHTTIEFYAFITNWSPSNTVGDKARVAFNLTIDGDVKFYNDNGMIWDGSGGGGDPEPPECTPSQPFEFTAARNQLVSHKRLTFSINGSPPSEFTGLAEPGGDDVDTNFESYFYHFGVNNRVGGNYFIISTSGGNQGAFRLGFDAESGQAIISARDDSYNPLSTTLELIATDHPDDFVTHYFGASVTLHACGTGEPA